MIFFLFTSLHWKQGDHDVPRTVGEPLIWNHDRISLYADSCRVFHHFRDGGGSQFRPRGLRDARGLPGIHHLSTDRQFLAIVGFGARRNSIARRDCGKAPYQAPLWEGYSSDVVPYLWVE